MRREKHCSVALLRPVPTEGTEFLRGDESAMPASERIRAQQLDMLVDETRSLIDEAAQQAEIRTDTTEYQLHAREGRMQVMSRRRTAHVREHDLVVSLDPTGSELGFLCTLIDSHALQRGLVFFTSRKAREDLFLLLGSKRIPVLRVSSDGGITFQKLPKLFSAHVPLNQDRAAEMHQENIAAAQLALRFPNIPLQEATREQFVRILIAERY